LTAWAAGGSFVSDLSVSSNLSVFSDFSVLSGLTGWEGGAASIA
jgi:hypothetical protein